MPPTTAPPATPPQRVLTAGPDGVIAVTDGVAQTLTTESMVIALDAGDGRVIVQRQAGQPQGRPWTEADTVPLELAPDGNLLTLFGGADWDGATVLHDIEVVGGRRLLLYSSQSELVPQESNEDLYVADLDTGERTLVANGIGGWEFGTSRLHLATTGLIVGQHNFSPSWAPLFLAVPFSPADGNLPSPSDVGLEDNYPDCAECPSAFTVSPDGLRLLWRSGLEPLVVGTSLADSSGARAPGVVPRRRGHRPRRHRRRGHRHLLRPTPGAAFPPTAATQQPSPATQRPSHRRDSATEPGQNWPGSACLRCGGGPTCSARRSSASSPRNLWLRGETQKSMSPPPGMAGASFSGLSAMTASVVRNRAAIDAAFCSAERVTLAASMMPIFTRSS